ncbi:Rieske 2Fe-2S domain-containing protein [Corynebacterium sp.]|uniref:Rieske 2Fe-2S domain-containing protein n=1 Tax=Corynebacterium sp. TaxID=1720 RepID=UPI0026DEED66|nr:Rieske 2Fe-2S domain-containing protein [Corynebacterium sp.]MDO5512077.1 Rieske 2Fe-2S domain-containing protein [Corynebacterium sp.]
MSKHTTVGEMKELASVDDLSPGSTKLVDDGLLLVRDLSGEFHLIADRCPHVGWSLSGGSLHDDAVIECPLHHGLWCLRDGEPVRYPARVPMTVYPVTVRDGRVYRPPAAE